MGGTGFLCASVPFALSLASMICVLLVIISGISDHSLDIFQINTEDLSISTSDLGNLADLVSRSLDKRQDAASEASSVLDAVSTLTASPTIESAISSVEADPGAITSTAATAGDILSGSNITAKDLGLADHYKIFLWNYCAVSGDDADCTDPKLDWASSATNTSKIVETAASLGVEVSLPHELTSALHIFSTVDKWTQIVYITAFVLSVLTTFIGAFILLSNCRRKNNGVSAPCITNLFSIVTTFFVLAAAVLATVMAEVAVEAVDNTAKAYGVTGSVNSSFLATTWLAFAFSFASTIFWAVDACCAACCCGFRKDDKEHDGLWTDKHRDLDSEDGDERDRLNRPLSDTPYVGGYEPSSKQQYGYVSEEAMGTPRSVGGDSPFLRDSPRLGGEHHSSWGDSTPTLHQGGNGGNGFWPQQRKQTDEGLEGFTHRGL